MAPLGWGGAGIGASESLISSGFLQTYAKILSIDVGVRTPWAGRVAYKALIQGGPYGVGWSIWGGFKKSLGQPFV